MKNVGFRPMKRGLVCALNGEVRSPSAAKVQRRSAAKCAAKVCGCAEEMCRRKAPPRIRTADHCTFQQFLLTGPGLDLVFGEEAETTTK